MDREAHEGRPSPNRLASPFSAISGLVCYDVNSHCTAQAWDSSGHKK